MNDPVHYLLAFNQKVMTVSDTIEQCHAKATFWMSAANMDAVNAFCLMNGYEKIDNKEKFGVLIAGDIVRIRG